MLLTISGPPGSGKSTVATEVADRFGLLPPWKQWRDRIAPISAKRGDVDALCAAVRTHLHDAERDDLFKHF